MHLLPHRVRLVGELLEESVVDAQDAAVGVEVFLAAMEVGPILFKSWSCVANGFPLDGDCCFTLGTDVKPSFPRP